MIVISQPEIFKHPDEIQLIHQMFEQGLEQLYLRKPGAHPVQFHCYLKQIAGEFHSKIALPEFLDGHPLFDSHSLHLSASQRDHCSYKSKVKYSTSTHSISEFNQLNSSIDQAFLSPIFPSISKPGYRVSTNWKEELKKRSNFNSQLIALGGIGLEQIPLVKAWGFDDFALMGFIWQSQHPLKNFVQCQKLQTLFKAPSQSIDCSTFQTD